MSAIAFELPPEVREACDGLTAFARSEIIPRHDKHRALLEDPAGSIGKMVDFLTKPLP